MPWGAPVWAKIEAVNSYGTSDISLSGNGGNLLTVPDAPHSLVQVVEGSGATSVGLDWEKATNEGGSPVIDY